MRLYSFFNSSASYRVRIALALKGLQYEYDGVNIRVREHRTPAFETLNPSRAVPLWSDGQISLGQSLAIIDYLDQTHPDVRLIPSELQLRARVLELSNAIACDIHPVNNMRVLRYLQDVLHVTADQKDAWYSHWIAEGLTMVEDLLKRYSTGTYCFGDHPTLADCCLVPQVANALRMGCDLSAYTRTAEIYEQCMAHPAFQSAMPSAQPDYCS